MKQDTEYRYNTVIFAGKILKIANCGESMKNHIFIDRLKELFPKVITIETHAPKHKPYRVLNLLWNAIIRPKIPIIISCSSREAYFFIRLLNLINRKHIYYWVIGGAFHKRVKEGRYKPSVYQKLDGIYVESHQMVKTLNNCGLYNVYYCPNFKQINYLPSINKPSNLTKFVFLSRIHPDKGCSLILDTMRELNQTIDPSLYNVTFYGPIANGYDIQFTSMVNDLPNASYKGFLDLTKKSGYDTLASYNIMLFPTWWNGEGFPGIIIDAFISGLPIIASDWNFNKELVDEKTGWIIKAKDEKALFECMLNVIQSKDIIDKSIACQSKSKSFDVRNVINKDFLSIVE